MWFAGLLIGMLLGGLLGQAEGAAFGALLGAVCGWVLGKIMGSGSADSKADTLEKNQRDNLDARLGHLQKVVEDVHWRLMRLEEHVGVSGSPLQTTSPHAATPTNEVANDALADMADPSLDLPVQLAQPAYVAQPSVTTIAESVPETSQTDRPGYADSQDQQPNNTAPLPASNPSTSNPVWAWLTGGNTIVRVGVLILFTGLAFLAKFAADHAVFPVELRLAAVGASAIGLLVLGWRLRHQPERTVYALTLQGTGIAALYLTIFAALRLYQLIPAGLAFPLLVAVAAFSALLALRQDALSLAATGAAGGFLAPILASTGQGSHVMLFSYYAVLNAGIFAIAWYKAWRPLNLLGFIFTFVIGLVWGIRFYQPEFLGSTEPFLILFFIAFVGIAILYAFKQAPKLTHYVDGTLIFGVPIVAFALQAGLMRDIEYGLAFSSLALAAFYLLLATWLSRRAAPQLTLLIESFLALGVIFATLAIPLALDARWTSAAWALEGAAIYWIGMRQDRLLARSLGLLLQPLAGLAFINSWHTWVELPPIINRYTLGMTLLASSGWFLNRQIRHYAARLTTVETTLAAPLFIWGWGWWLAMGLSEINRFRFDYEAYLGPARLAFLTLTTLAFSLAHFRLHWREAAWPQRVLLGFMLILLGDGLLDHGHVMAHGGWLVWPLALIVHGYLLKRHAPEAHDSPNGLQRFFSIQHSLTLLILASIGATELHWLAGEYDLHRSAWSVAAVMLIPCGLLLWSVSARAQTHWPVRQFPQAYWLHAGIPLLLSLGLWSLYANFTHDGQSAPLPYLPLLNALDLGHGFLLLTALAWWRRTREQADVGAILPLFRILASALGFIWLNAILLRTLHHVADIPYTFEPMMQSVLVQASLSVFWTLLALTLMLIAKRKVQRGVWMVGAALMAVVVGKLLLIDLSSLEGVARIISFMGVGVLMLIMGYVAPLPPAQKAERPAEELP